MHPLAWFAIGAATNYVLNLSFNGLQSNYVAAEARRYAHSRGKPVLDFGCGASPRGDYNVDVQPRNAPNFIQVHSFEKPKLPFSDKQFGAALCFHVIEHVADPEHMVKELNRVADKVYVITPHPLFWRTWVHGGHRWVFLNNDVYFKNPVYDLFHPSPKVLREFPLLYPGS